MKTGNEKRFAVGTAKVNGNDVKNRYSEQELQVFKELLLKNKEEAEEIKCFIKGELRKTGSNGTEDTDPPIVGENKEGESFGYDREINEELLKRQEKLIKCIDFALERVKDSAKFGICQVTGKLIPMERLLIVPHATLSVEGKNKLN